MKIRAFSLCLALLLLLSLFGACAEMQGEIFVREGGGTLNLRAGKSTSTESLGYIQHGQAIEVLELGDEWSLIYVPTLDKTGYIRTKYIINITEMESNDLAFIDFTPAYDFALGYGAPVEMSCDLDGDGSAEDILLDYTVDSYDRQQAMLTVHAADGSFAQKIFDIESGASLWLVKLDDSGRVYCFVSGDECSDDYVTACVLWTGTGFTSVLFEGEEYVWGGVHSISDSVITVSAFIDVLGTWSATADYVLNDGSFVRFTPNWLIPHDLCDADSWTYRALIVKEDMPVEMLGELARLDEGTRILPVAYNDQTNVVTYVTERGRVGSFSVVRDEENWGLLIHGMHESEYFDNLVYAG